MRYLTNITTHIILRQFNAVVGTKNPSEDDGNRQCFGMRGLRKVISEPMPPLLMIKQLTNLGVVSHGAERSKLTSMDKIVPHCLKINGTSYGLVNAVLSNTGHFRGVAIIHGKYLIYDGMFGGNRLRWIQPNTKFASAGDDYCDNHEHFWASLSVLEFENI